jgi:transposase-like protein
MYVQGVSTRKVREITEALCGTDISSAQVSRAAKLLDVELEAWRNRPLGTVPYVILDARYEKVRHGGSPSLEMGRRLRGPRRNRRRQRRQTQHLGSLERPE